MNIFTLLAACNADYTEPYNDARPAAETNAEIGVSPAENLPTVSNAPTGSPDIVSRFPQGATVDVKWESPWNYPCRDFLNFSGSVDWQNWSCDDPNQVPVYTNHVLKLKYFWNSPALDIVRIVEGEQRKCVPADDIKPVSTPLAVENATPASAKILDKAQQINGKANQIEEYKIDCRRWAQNYRKWYPDFSLVAVENELKLCLQNAELGYPMRHASD